MSSATAAAGAAGASASASSSQTSTASLPTRRLVAEAAPDAPSSCWSNGIQIGPDLVLSGMTAYPASSVSAAPLSTYDQTVVVLAKIRSLLEAAGGSISNITKLVIYLTDIADKDEVNRARRECFAGIGGYPASTLVAVSALVFPELTVEIEATARLDFDLSQLAAPGTV